MSVLKPSLSLRGNYTMGELVTREQSAGRLLSQAVYAWWERQTVVSKQK
jgi:hypothetical protein